MSELKKWWIMYTKYGDGDENIEGPETDKSGVEVVEYSAYEDIKNELAECVKTHDENIDVLKSFQSLFTESKAELEKLIKERDEAILQRDHFEKSQCRGELLIECARSARLVEALRLIAKDNSFDGNLARGYCNIAREALAEHESHIADCDLKYPNLVPIAAQLTCPHLSVDNGHCRICGKGFNGEDGK